MKFKYMALAATLVMALASSASAVTIKIQRISDKVAILTGSGNLTTPPSSNHHVWSLAGVYGTDPTATENESILTSSTLTIGAAPVTWVNSVGTAYGGPAGIYMGAASLGAFGPGALTLTLATGTWGSVGSTGDVYWGPFWFPSYNPQVNGTWEIVGAVPLPASLPLFLAAFAGLGFAARRRKS